MTEKIIKDIADLYHSLSDADRKFLPDEERLFGEMLYFVDSDDIYPYYQHGKLVSVMFIVSVSKNYIICFTHPEWRKCGLQKDLLGQVKRKCYYLDRDRELCVKIDADNIEGWKRFWQEEGFEKESESDGVIRLRWRI